MAPKKKKAPEVFAGLDKPKHKEYEPNKLVMDHGAKCPHCPNRHGHKVTHTYPNGNRRATCGECGKPMIIRRAKQ